MKCPNCGHEVDTSICVACPNCRTKMPNAHSYPPEIGMQDSFGNKITVGGNFDKTRKKANIIAGIMVAVLVVAAAAVYIGVKVYNYYQPRTHEEAIILAREDAKEVVNKQLRYQNLNTWYANTYIDDNGDNKFIIYCDVKGILVTGEYGRIQMYVGIELRQTGKNYTYWTTGNIYPNGDSTPNPGEPAYNYVQQLKNAMGW